MDEFFETNGIFVPEDQTKSFLMCLLSFVNAFPSTELSSIEWISTPAGYKVYFKQNLPPDILTNTFLSLHRVFPLFTYLYVSNVKNHIQEYQLKSAIEQKFKISVLRIKKLTQKKKKSDQGINYLVQIDLPDVDIFRTFPNHEQANMSITFPQDGKPYEVSLWCRCCKIPGHSSERCSKQSNVNEHQASTSAARSFSELEGNSQTQSIEPELFVFGTDRNEGCLRNIDTTSANVVAMETESTKVTKEEPVENTNMAAATTSSILNDLVPSYFQDLLLNSQMKGIESQQLTFPSSPFSFKDLKRLSPYLQKIIEKVCKEHSVLSSEKLNAFLSQIKNQNIRNLVKITQTYYTNNLLGLINQLEEILRSYFGKEKKGTEKDRLFIGWLQKLIDRFKEACAVYYQMPI